MERRPFDTIKHSKRRASILWGSIFGIALIRFFYSLYLENTLAALGVFYQYDVLFEADPNHRWIVFGHGISKDGNTLVHPGLRFYFSNILNIFAEIAVCLGSQYPRAIIREQFALYIIPIFASVKPLVLYRIFDYLSFPSMASILMIILYSFGFSNLIFDGIPEHFAISALGQLVLVYLMLKTLKEKKINWWQWILLTILLIGVTTTNIIWIAMAVAIVLFFQAATTERNIITTTLFCTITLLFSLFLFQGMQHFSQPDRELESFEIVQQFQPKNKEKSLQADYHWIQRNMSTEPLNKIIQYPLALQYSLFGTIPDKTINFRSRQKKYPFQLSFESKQFLSQVPEQYLQSILFFSWLIFAVVGWRKHITETNCPNMKSKYQAILIFSIVMIIVNGCFHACWGDEYFLYSQHWYLAVILLCMGVFFIIPKMLYPFVVIVIGLSVVQNLQTIRDIIQLLNI